MRGRSTSTRLQRLIEHRQVCGVKCWKEMKLGERSVDPERAERQPTAASFAAIRDRGLGEDVGARLAATSGEDMLQQAARAFGDIRYMDTGAERIPPNVPA